MITKIILIILIIVLLIMSIILLRGKGGILIAGYNLMSKEKRNNIMKKLFVDLWESLCCVYASLC
ncbi:hypothetical protein AZF37_05920 [endosymbiont 'TC1' of Trimyema compressum]|uniref:DUF3784 domain-containing protein n=1 Tax=endosymbiont 'TC1' of Trimyema compressum TaxID=243899 RepID=UPI0007F1459C|nr:DUF3784 domain-containing protein [endosymbiont 'TC1' of Trimyema compressum]AMP20776.1 hypothetical protein AZF37_05920 [endosymbiont 'TC1' of Trimyema compressum]